jgi:hypothetical protein
MSVVFQLAGKAIDNGKAEELAAAFVQMEKGLRNEPGFARATLLLSRLTLQCQFLFYWSTYEEGLAFNKKFQLGLSARFAPLMEKQTTLITSMLEEEVGQAPQAGKVAPDAADGQVVLHFSGSAQPAGIPMARAVLHDALLPLFATCPGFQGLSVLVNHQEGKLQFLATFEEFERSFGWVRDHAKALLTPFDGVVTDPTLPGFFAVMGDIRMSEAAAAR